MIVFVRSADVLPGKMGPAMTFAGEIKGLVKKLTGVDLSLMMPIGGNPNQIFWRTSYESLAEMDATQAKLMSDDAYSAKLVETGDLFLPGSIRDQIFRVVG